MTVAHNAPLRDPWNLAGKTVGGRFVVSALVAEGGSGRVYKAQDSAGGGFVALKVLRPDPDAEEHEVLGVGAEFEQEVAALDRLEHPTIVPCVGHGEVDIGRGRRSLFLALEWVDGVTLDKHLEAVGRLSPAEALTLLRPLLDALAQAHSVGIAHRDLKPGNVMVEGSPDRPRVRLLDFGIAKLMSPDEALGEHTALTLSRNPAFSPAYAAPEQLSGAKTGPWTDVHATALLITQAILGAAPYRGVGFAAMLREALSPQRPTPGARGVDVGPLEAVLEQALALRPQGRFQNVAELRDALDALRGAGPAQAASTATAPAVATEPVKRFPIEIAVGVGVGMLLAVVVAVALFR